MQELLTLTEEKLKSKIKDLYFKKFNYFGDKIDFCITQNLGILGEINLLWAEAKNGKDSCIYESFIQLILTIGKYRYNTQQTPKFLGAFDAQKFAFLPYASIQEVFYQNDIDWSVTPSNHKTPQFLSLLTQLKPTLENEMIAFSYESQSKELSNFITQNLTTDEITKYEIDKNNFVSVYFKWLEVVRDTISIDWDRAKQAGIIDADFYLADLLSNENITITEKLYAVLRGTYYEFNKTLTFLGTESNEKAFFKDNQEAHRKFWSVYKRPPREEFWSYIIERRDLLVSQDIRERTGAFFTPKIWVQKSQEYLAKALGEDWQDEYYIWDCAGGTGNLLAGLTNHRNVFCSTLDSGDVKAVKQRNEMVREIFDDHVFQFDFLNDEFFDKVDDKGNVIVESKIPKKLQEILKDEKKRKKLVIYINPPYVEASSYGEGGKDSVANETKIFDKYKPIVGAEAMNELFAQFFIRIYSEIGNCILAEFSTFKFLLSKKFTRFREFVKIKYLNGFMVPADTFDNVGGVFPIGFMIWDLSAKKSSEMIELSIYNKDNQFLGTRSFVIPDKTHKSISDWRRTFYDRTGEILAEIILVGASIQSNNNTFICSKAKDSYRKKSMVASITKNNLLYMGIYLAVRHAVEATWINDRDEYSYPNSMWEQDKEFQSDCLAFTLFHRQNYITSKDRINHFIPFTESEVRARSAFESDFMTRFMRGKIKINTSSDSLFGSEGMSEKLEFSSEAKAVFEAGKEIFAYYHAQDFSTKPYNVNASFYDIKEFFQGRNAKGKMNKTHQAKDTHYKDLMDELADSLNTLAKKLKPKIYEYGFLKE